jgi:drug/metabolite transporter (DMT)-like permease
VTPGARGEPGGGPEARPYAGALLVAGAACAFGAISTLIVFATRGAPGRPGASLESVLFWRYVLAGLVLGPLAWAGWRRAGGTPALGAAGWARALALGGLGQAAVAFLSLSAVRFIPVATLGFLFYTFPAWVALFAVLGGSERLDRAKLAALALSLAGIACTVGVPGGTAAGGPASGGAGPAWPGVLLALSAAVVYAVYVPYLGRLQARLGPVGAGAAVCAGAAVVLGVAGVARGTLTAALAPGAWAAVAVLALVCTVVAFVAFMRGLGLVGPVRAAITSTVEPFFTAVLGALVLGQPFGAATVAGGALIAAAVLLLQRPPRPASGLHPGGADTATDATPSHEVHA